MQRKFIYCSQPLARVGGLSQFLGGELAAAWWCRPVIGRDTVIAWGKKPSSRKAYWYAKLMDLPLVRIEDGFLRSVGLGNTQPLSMVVDDVGIYYDATQPSRLESDIRLPLNSAEQQRAKSLQQSWCEYRVSKYNDAAAGKAPEQPFVLLVDQTRHDVSLRYGMADAGSFSRMLHRAAVLYPSHQLLIKIHPDVLAGKKQGCIDLAEVRNYKNAVLWAEPCHAPTLLQQADAVFTVTSQLGFEALLWQKPVYCFGMPFYAGWGLTQDDIAAPKRRTAVPLLQLVYAALVRYPRYIDPINLQRCEVEVVLNYLAAVRLQKERPQVLRTEIQGLQIPLWKKPLIRKFLPQHNISFVEKAERLNSSSLVCVWGQKQVPSDINPCRIEDGFIRSVGLGAELNQPVSWVFDPVGLYYDASRPSALECMLQQAKWSDVELQRAERLQAALLDMGLSKYNLSQPDWKAPQDHTVVLVIGQVETDASIALAAGKFKHNIELLQHVSWLRPDSYVVFKPHPDEVAGLRQKSESSAHWQRFCDEVVTDCNILSMLEQADEVHVNTSLTGFEALLRGKKVFCYGMPFYAGWGLTNDSYDCSRRSRKLSLSELVYATLIVYPKYISPLNNQLIEPEQALRELHQLVGQGGSDIWRRCRRFLIRTLVGIK